MSYAQNHEDVVLWRALRSVPDGRYVEIGANDPEIDSITKAFYDRGWSGLEVEPEPEFARRYRESRTRDVVVEAAVTGQGDSVVLHRIAGTGLSTTVGDVDAGHRESGFAAEDLTVRGVRLDDLLAETGFDSGDVHFLVVDVEGAEAEVLSTVDLRAWRPWVLVIEATEPASTRSTRGAWEADVLEAGYQFCLFDGLSCFYVAEEHAPTLARSLSYGATATDDFLDALVVRLQTRLDEVTAEMAELAAQVAEEQARTQEWRTRALVTWAEGLAQAPDLEAHRNEMQLLRLALDKAEKKVGRQADRIKTLRRELGQAAAAADSQPGAGPTMLGKAARSLSRRAR